MKVLDIVKAINGTVINKKKTNISFNRICINSSEVKEGDIFIALIGKNLDGHDYISDALSHNPSAIIISKDMKIKTKVPIIKVKDTNDALIDIGMYYRNNFKGEVVAITGSAGKTMTKELIYSILSKKYKVLKNDGNKNNHIGVPLTLTNLNNSYELCVLELGMNHQGEISKLSKMSKPNTSVITNIGTSHIGNLGSAKNIFKAKMEILDGMDKKRLVINTSDKYMKKVKNTITTDDLVITKIESDLYKTCFTLKYDNKNYNFTLNVPGEHLIQNCLLAIKVGLIYNIPMDDIIDSINSYKPLNHRLNIIKLKNNILIDDCYNSNYESVVSLISYVKKLKDNNIVILGDILELGKYSKKIHKKIGKILQKISINNLIFVGKDMYYAHKKNKTSKYFKTNIEVINYLKTLDISKTNILVKASRGMLLEEICEFLKEKFS